MKKIANLGGLIAIVLVTLAPYSASAQQGIITIDNVSCFYHGDSVLLPTNMIISLRFSNNTVNKVDIRNGFEISSPDGALWDSTTIALTGAGTFASYFNLLFFTGMYSGDGLSADTAGILGAGTQSAPQRQMPAGYNDVPIKVTLWNIGEFNHGKHICIDSCSFPPGGAWSWESVVSGNEITYRPEFMGIPGQSYTPGAGYCFTLYHMPCGAARNQALAVTSDDNACPCSHCCIGTTGNVNETGIVDLSDLSSLVSYLTGGGFVLPCDEEANINAAGIVDVSDLSALVNYLTGDGYVLPNCP